MSGSVTTARVAPTPAELERLARERARRERERQIRERFEATVGGLRAATVVAVAPAARQEQAGSGHGVAARAAGRARTAAARQSGRVHAHGLNLSPGRDSVQERGVIPRAGETSPAPRPAPPAPTPPAGGDVRSLARALAAEARDRGFPALAAEAQAVSDVAGLIALEGALDDAIDAADTAALVEAHVDAAAQAILGTGWTAQPDTAGRRRVSAAGDTMRSHVHVDEDGSAVVEIVVDARVPRINGLPSATCAQEDRISNAIIDDLPSEQLEVVEPAKVARRSATRLGGLVAATSERSAKTARTREARRT